MINSDIEDSIGNSSLINASKKNIRIESALVIGIGLLLLVFFTVFFNINYFWSYIPMSILYILTGISGCMCTRSNNSGSRKLYKVLIIVLMLLNIIFLGFLIFLVVVLLLNPSDCSKSSSDTCGVGAAIWVILMVISIVSFIVVSGTLGLLYVMLKHLNKYQDDIESLRLIPST